MKNKSAGVIDGVAYLFHKRGRSVSLFKHATCCVLVWVTLVAKAQDPNLHIYLCFGQSNMEGAGAIETQDKSDVDARFRVMGAVNCNASSKSYALGKWQTATPPTFRCYTGLSVTDYFGRTMVANLPSDIKIGIVPVAIGGCDIALFDKINYGAYVATAPSWMIGAINEYGGNPYARLVQVAKLAQKEGVIKGILLHQGETNNGQDNWPTKIKAIYNNLVADLGLDPTKTPLLAGELVTTAQGGACGFHNSIIAKLPSVLPNSFVVSAAGLPHTGDKLHFTSAAYRTLGQRYAEKMLSLYPKGNAPTVSITSPSNNSSFTTLQTVSLSANAADTDGTITKVEFYDGTTLLGSDNTSPYHFTWSGMSAGIHTVTAKAIDNAGLIASSPAVLVSIEGVQSAYPGATLAIPGRIEAEAYDLGGEEVSYREADANGNQGGATLRNDQVDIEATGDEDGAYNVGYILKGEWLEYTVNVASTGTYTIDLRVAANGDGKTFHVEMDGADKTGPISVPNTGGWQNWKTVSVADIALISGQHVMRIAFDTDYMNLNYVEFKKSTITGSEDDRLEPNLMIYPNPFSSTLSFYSRDLSFVEKITVYDMVGNEVESLKKSDLKGPISFGESLKTGQYFVHIVDQKTTKVFKVTKQ